MRALFPGAAQWLLVIWVVCFVHDVTSRPSTSQSTQSTPPTLLSTASIALEKNNSSSNLLETSTVAEASIRSNSREDKTNTPAIGESIKMVANQLLQGNKTPPPATGEGGTVEDVRTPPRMKNQQNNKNKNTKPPTSTASAQIIESSHAGVAVPMDADDIEKPVLKPVSYSNKLTTTDEGLSTWILLSGNPTTPNPKTPMKTIELEIVVDDKKGSKEEIVEGNDIKKVTENNQKPKPSAKPIRKTTTVVPIKPIFTRKPIAIGSSNKSDLIASGSAVNEKVMNKIKASVLANVQKNKFAALNRTTTSTSQPIIEVTSTTAPSQEQIDISTTEKTTTIKTPTTSTSPKIEKIKVSVEKPHKIKSKPVAIEIESKNKVMDKEMEIKANDINVESKEAEIELEVSTPPPATTKKPKRTSNKRKKNKNRRRSKPSTTTEKPDVAIESKNNNNTKLASKIAQKEKPITTQIYNYLSREVMPSVGVGIVSIAGLVGLASYFLYPFSGVVRRAYDINDRKDDLYQQNGEQYATAEGGQTEEEMLGSFFPEEPSTKKNNRNNVNPYAGQTQFRYPQVKKVQDPNIRYRNVAHGSDTNSFLPSDRVGQQSIEQIKGAAYSEQIHYDTHMPEDEDNYSNLRYQHPQPIYQSSELNSEETAFGSDSLQATYSTQNKIADPTYGQAMRYSQEVIVNDATKSPGVGTLHLGVDDVIEQQKETGYTVAIVGAEEKQPQFVVGNVPVELIQTVTPITVPEHGPRSLRIRKRSIPVTQYEIPTYISSVADSLEQVFKKSRENESESDISNEISDSIKETTIKYQPSTLLVHKENLPAYNPDTNLPISFDVATSGMKMSDTSFDNVKKENVIKNKANKSVSKDDFTKEEKKKENIFSKGDHHKEKYADTNIIDKLSKEEPKTSGIAEILTIKNTQGSKIVIMAEDSIKSQYTSAPSIDMISIGNIGDFLSTRKYGRLETSSMTNKEKADISTTTTTLPVVEIIKQKDKLVSDRTKNKENIKSPADLISVVLTKKEANEEDYVLPSNPEKRAPLFIEITTKDANSTDEAPTDDPLLEVTTTYKSESTSTKPGYPGTDDYPNTDPFETHPKPFSFLGFLKSLVEFKIRLGMSILQTTSDSLARYLRNMETTMKTASRTSGHLDRPYYNNK